ncbi:MAG: NAD-dependent epimerase/dehydratase family protein [Elusimicrobia bacterium]|nr:NAD-dependent epimerase/dehydratase family protein [Elusimicrobiota bacterium]
MKTVLLTGGTGFVGGCLAESLIRSGVKTRCLVRPRSRYEGLAALGAELVSGGLDDPEALAKACKGCDTVFHAAGKTKVSRSAEYFHANVDGTARLVRAVEDAAPDARFVHVSSLAAAGPSKPDAPRTEDEPPEPVSVYGQSKLAGEEVLRVSKLRWVIARPPAVYGPKDTDVFSFFKLASLGLSPVIGGVERSLSLIHVSDLAKGLILCAEAKPGSLYFLADPTPYPLDAVMACIAGVLGRRLRRVEVPYAVVAPAAYASGLWSWLSAKPGIFGPDKLRELRQAHWTCSAARACMDLGFSADYPLAKGIAHAAAWYQANGWL